MAALAAWRFLRPAFPFALAAFLIAFGASWTQLDAAQKRQVILGEALSPRPIEGVVEDIERTEHGVRFTLSHVTIEGIAPQTTPRTVRLSLRLKAGSDLAWPHVGDAVALRAGAVAADGPGAAARLRFRALFLLSRHRRRRLRPAAVGRAAARPRQQPDAALPRLALRPDGLHHPHAGAA
ncbi:MAG: hypothetical protein WDN72_09450 [Alphaproteobacteria bacterium]